MTEKINAANEQGYELKKVNVDNLVKHDMHPREEIGDIESLEQSIRLDGLQEPILVHEKGEDNFDVLDGMRRLQASRNLGVEEVECLVKKKLSQEVSL